MKIQEGGYLLMGGREPKGGCGDSGSAPVLDGGGGYIIVGFVIIH